MPTLLGCLTPPTSPPPPTPLLNLYHLTSFLARGSGPLWGPVDSSCATEADAGECTDTETTEVVQNKREEKVVKDKTVVREENRTEKINQTEQIEQKKQNRYILMNKWIRMYRGGLIRCSVLSFQSLEQQDAPETGDIDSDEEADSEIASLADSMSENFDLYSLDEIDEFLRTLL